MDLSDFILNRKIANVGITSNISDFPKCDKIQEQEGDIPALFGFDFDGTYFEISVLADLSDKTSLNDLADFLKSTNLEFDIVASKFAVGFLG
ncbi:hypothetical protein [Flavobacterium sp.]|uniref:hypothetical protein n=1 Tax=Flavobacterium sp. TaxID=239 RepID=UPI0012064777|nr:hypothetical protein [Flavobacterium sp.]RZJ73497.1 MAG: hypothetical protein EOO49_01400 [Flavobacterium sp.]